MMRELLHLRLGLLELVDLSIDSLELLGVVGAVVFPAGHSGDFLQHALIKVLRVRVVYLPPEEVHQMSALPIHARTSGLTAFANADRVNLHPPDGSPTGPGG